MAIAKKLNEEVEFFVPPDGLNLDHYLKMKLPPSAGARETRLRKQAVHHLARYHWAARVLSHRKPGRILDVACGSGYGSAILASGLPGFTVIGGDYDSRAIEHATNAYGGLSNLSYQAADVVSWLNPQTEEPLGEFDYVVSFDTIEHLLFRELALINFAENVGEALFLSTPVRSQNLLNPGWEHHKIEYSGRHLYNLVRRFFNKIAIPDDESLPELAFWTNVVNGEAQEYLLRCNPMVCERPIRIGMQWPPA